MIGMGNAYERAHLFGRHDRLMIDGRSYRVEKKLKGTHFLQPCNDDFIEDHFVPKTDKQINTLIRANRLRIDEGYFSKVLTTLRVKHDNSDLSDLSDDELRTVVWKLEWCTRFLHVAGNPKSDTRLKRTTDDYSIFIENEKANIEQWYLDRFGKRRPPGRRQKGEQRKSFDYPSPSTLRDWLKAYREHGYLMKAFRPEYAKCGNRSQLDERAVPVVTKAVKKFSSKLRPTIGDIVETVELELDKINRLHPNDVPITVSERAIRRRINKIDPFIRDLSRYGEDYAMRKYTPVGKGVAVSHFLERVEMDDWTADLHALVAKSTFWKSLTAKQKAAVPRTRVNLTVAIDKVTRCVVGLHASEYTPSVATSKSCLRSVMIDKTRQAKWAGAQSDWPMHGKVGYLATDGGPVFQGEFEDTIRSCLSGRSLADQDPRMRGTIESFFKTLERVCRYFAGRSFRNVVEKGDYPAEKLATLTFEQFYRQVIVFIVDRYHHHAHRGLNRGTPYGMWKLLIREGEPPAISNEQLKVAFGFKWKGKVDKSGMVFDDLRYHSNELAALHRIVGDRDLETRIDPDDLATMLITVPKQHRDRKELGGRTFITAECQTTIRPGLTLVDKWAVNKEVQKLVKEQQDAGKPFRLAAHANLLETAERVRREANLPSSEMSQSDFDAVMRRIERKTQAAFGMVNYSKEPIAEDGKDLGRVVARGERRVLRSAEASTEAMPPESSKVGRFDSSPDTPQPKKPFGGSMNLDGED